MNVVCFGQQNWDVCWVTKQQLMTRLARRGHRVLFVDPIPDLSHTSPQARRQALFPHRSGLGIRQIEDGLHVFTPPWAHLLPAWVNRRRRRAVVRAVAERLGLWAPVAICLWPAQRWLMDGLDPAARIYFAEDDNAGFGGMDAAFVEHQRLEEQRLLRECDLALAVSPTLLDRFKPIQPRSYLQENGVALDDFSPAALQTAPPHPVLANLPRPRVGFVGQIDDRMDQDLVVALAQRLAKRDQPVQVILAGRVKEGVDVSRLAAEANIHLSGFVPYTQLPGVYRELDVGLVPYVDSPLTQSCNPLKVYEYLAADLPTVSTALRGLNTTRKAITTAESREAFLEGVEAALQDPDRLRETRREVAESASWQRRADLLEERMQQALNIAAQRREQAGLASPRPDRHGRIAIRVEPRLDGKDASVRLLHDNYAGARFTTQQHLMYLASRSLGLGWHLLRRGSRLLHGDLAAVRKILVVRNGHLGDTVVFFPTLEALRRRFPEAHLTVAVAPGGGARRLLEASPFVDEVLELDFFNHTRRKRFRGAAHLLARGFDLVLGGVWYFHLPEAVFSGAPLRLGLYDGHPLQRYADRVMMLDPGLHEAENNLRLVELVTGPVPPHRRVPKLALDEPQVARKGQMLREDLGIPTEAPVIAMHPGSKRPSRRWPNERFAELADGLLRDRPDLHVVFTGAGPEEAQLVERILGRIGSQWRDRAHSAVGKADLVGLIGFYDGCRLLVCNDTGVMHVARARAVPVVAIIGPENDRRWGPHPLGAAPAVVVRAQVPGTPHGKWTCEWNLSLGAVEAARVRQHVERLLDGRPQGEPVVLEDERFYPLVRDVQRLSFAQLVERGLCVPEVAVVLPQDPKLLGFEGQAVSAAHVLTAARAVRQQVYPSLQTLIVTHDTAALRAEMQGETDADLRLVEVPQGDPDTAWARVLGQTDAPLVLPLGPQVTLETSAVANRVAVYIRGPQVDAADAARAWPVRAMIDKNLLEGQWLLTRSALEMLLEHPIPLPPQALHAPEPSEPPPPEKLIPALT